MRTRLWIATAAVAALAGGGAAVAHTLASKGVAVVATSFTAAPTSATRTRSCTDASGAVWHVTNGVYQGTATGDLAGAITIRSQSVIDTATGNGFTRGTVLLRDGSNRLLAKANLDAVNTQNGVLNGLLRGRTSGGMLLANFTASFNADGSALSGTVGSGTGTNSAIVYGGLPKCQQTSVTPPKPILRVEGTVTAASSTSLTISARKQSFAITVPSSLAAQAGALKVGDHVEVTAAQVNGAYVLVTLRTRGHGH